MKASYKEIREIIECTPAELKGKSTLDIGRYEIVGHFHPTNANWSYQVACVVYNGAPYLVVLQFGYVQ